MHLMSAEQQNAFDAPHFPEVFGEVGSRDLQRIQDVEMAFEPADTDRRNIGFLMNDWLEVQEERYRYLAIEDPEGVIVRIVIGEYLAASVTWHQS